MIRPCIRSIRTAAFASLAALALGCGKGQDRRAADAGTILTARTLGLAYVEENRLAEAEEQFVKLIRLAPEEPSGHANLGLVYLRLGRNQDAARAIERAVALAPEDPGIRLLQATVLRLTGRPAEARRVLESVLKTAPTHLKTLYALAEADSGKGRREYLARLVEAAPANVPARLAFAATLLDAGATAEARDQLELLRQRLPKVPREAERFYAAAVTQVQANRPADARVELARAKAFLETTPIYQAGMAELRGPTGAPPGYPVLTLSPRLALEERDPQAVVNALRFTEVAVPASLDSQFPMGNGPIARGDYDNDGYLDVYAAGALFRNDGTGRFTRATGIGDSAGARTAFFADLDHDGDLDLFLGTSTGDRIYRNNGDGTFREQDLQPGPTTGAVFGDFDADARTDVIAVHQDDLVFYRGLEEGKFEVRTIPAHAQTIAAGDYDNDGFLDLFAGAFYRNDGAGNFARDTRAGGGGTGGDPPPRAGRGGGPPPRAATSSTRPSSTSTTTAGSTSSRRDRKDSCCCATMRRAGSPTGAHCFPRPWPGAGLGRCARSTSMPMAISICSSWDAMAQCTCCATTAATPISSSTSRWSRSATAAARTITLVSARGWSSGPRISIRCAWWTSR